MHITDKEKKAIYEAMKQIRENQGTKTKLDETVMNFRDNFGQKPPGARRQAQMQADRADRPSVLNSFLNRTMDRGQDLLQKGTDAVGRITGTGKYVLPDMHGRRRSPIVDELEAIVKNPGRTIRRLTGNETPSEYILRKNAQPYPGRQVIMGEQQSRPQSAPMSTPDGSFNLGAELASRSRTAQKPPGARRSSDMSNRRLERKPSSENQFSLAPPIRFDIYGNRIRQFKKKELLGPIQYSTKTKVR